MRHYTIHYKDGSTEDIEVAGRKELIDTLFGGSEDTMKEKVETLRWQSANMFFNEDVASGKIDSQITTADANPYGWRNEGDLEH